jgi:hypothetical protein
LPPHTDAPTGLSTIAHLLADAGDYYAIDDKLPCSIDEGALDTAAGVPLDRAVDTSRLDRPLVSQGPVNPLGSPGEILRSNGCFGGTQTQV